MTSSTEARPGNVASLAEAKREKLFAFNRAAYGDVIRRYRLEQGLNTVEFAEKIHSTKNNVCNWETGRARPDINLLPAICKALGISVGRFFGQPESPSDLDEGDRALLARYHALSPENRSLADAMLRAMLDGQDGVRDFVRIFRNAEPSAAGVGVTLSDRVRGEYVYVQSSAQALAADEIITVSGDSMEPTFRNGDDLFVRHTSRIQPGEIGIFIAGGEGYVKEYRPDGLYSHNPAYPPMRFYDEDGARCVGRVLGVVDKRQYTTRQEAAALARRKK